MREKRTHQSPLTSTFTVRHSILAFAVAATVLYAFSQSPTPQPASYHLMADRRPCIGIPNCLNVLSNVPFAIGGIWGLAVAWSLGLTRKPAAKHWERLPYLVLFTGVTLTTLGSGYYHLAPDNERLVWDRLPMTVGFMGLLTAMLGERVSMHLGRFLLGPLLGLGAVSVLYWFWSEHQHHGDLRFYFLVQFGSLLLVLLLILLYPARLAGTAYLVAGLATYVGAKGLEELDLPIFALGQVVSGHTLKHLIAAGAVGFLVLMLRARTRVNTDGTPRCLEPIRRVLKGQQS